MGLKKVVRRLTLQSLPHRHIEFTTETGMIRIIKFLRDSLCLSDFLAGLPPEDEEDSGEF
jgi:hypothetical protein